MFTQLNITRTVIVNPSLTYENGNNGKTTSCVVLIKSNVSHELKVNTLKSNYHHQHLSRQSLNPTTINPSKVESLAIEDSTTF